MASVTQVRRLLNLLEKLRSDEGYNARQLAEQLGVSRRTMFRDLRSLEKLGVRAEFDDRNQRYVVTMSEELTQAAEISPAELQSLLALSEDSAAPQQSPHGAAYRLGFNISETGGRGAGAPIESLVAAVFENRVVEITLESGDTWTREPIRLFNVAGQWLLVAKHQESDAVHMVEIADIANVKHVDVTFAGYSPEQIASFVEAAWASAATDEAVIRFAADTAELVTGSKQLPVQDVQWESGGGLTVRTPMIDARLLATWVLSFGCSAEVVSPADLREAVVKEVTALHDVYTSNFATA